MSIDDEEDVVKIDNECRGVPAFRAGRFYRRCQIRARQKSRRAFRRLVSILLFCKYFIRLQ